MKGPSLPADRPPFLIRPAVVADIPVITALIDASVRSLHAADHTPEQIDGALGTVFGVDTCLLDDGTYYAVETPDPAQLIAVGGWSKRRTLFGSDRAAVRQNDLLDPAAEPARIRAFFVHPQWTRRGLGTLLLDHCEAAATAAGFQSFELGATLSGERLYRTRGYREVERSLVPLPNGLTLPIVRMRKSAAHRDTLVTMLNSD